MPSRARALRCVAHGTQNRTEELNLLSLLRDALHVQRGELLAACDLVTQLHDRVFLPDHGVRSLGDGVLSFHPHLLQLLHLLAPRLDILGHRFHVPAHLRHFLAHLRHFLARLVLALALGHTLERQPAADALQGIHAQREAHLEHRAGRVIYWVW